VPPVTHVAFQSWSLPLPVTLLFILAALFYLRGWLCLRRSSSQALSPLRLAAFLSGMLSAWIAVGSPLAALDDQLLTVHMLQHILLMTVASPLILLGEPGLPFQQGLPQRSRWTSVLVARNPALQDQECAGAVMWVSATFIYLIPAVIVTIKMLSPL
jgi:cytochrome c oxidase assembly factor CtaG